MCDIGGRVAESTSLPKGGICCNQPVKDYSEASEQHADTSSSSAAEPASSSAARNAEDSDTSSAAHSDGAPSSPKSDNSAAQLVV